MVFGKALVVGLAKDVGNVFEKNFDALSSAMSVFDSVCYYVVESDSSDNTLEILFSVNQKCPSFQYVSLGNLSDQLPNRVDRIVYCRNTYLNHFFMRRDEFDYLIVADLDGVNEGLSRSALASVWCKDIEWDGVFANQSAPYYDVWALRHDAWCPGDCWKNYRFLKGIGHSDDRALWDAVLSKMINIPTDQNWIPVRSAFGGLGIYKAASFPKEYYSCYDEQGEEVCEHVNLHLSSGFRDKKLFINPALINGGLNGHSEKALMRNRVKRSAKRIERNIRDFRDRMGVGLKFGRLKRLFEKNFHRR